MGIPWGLLKRAAAVVWRRAGKAALKEAERVALEAVEKKLEKRQGKSSPRRTK